MSLWLLLGCTETAPAPTAETPAPTSEDCGDGLDNDWDGWTDCFDADCLGDASCAEDCGDGRDNDQDGDADCYDSDCLGDPECSEDCFDGVDNDKDAHTDCQDTDCSMHPDCIEDCGDGHDNDQDGAVDCEDTECWEQPGCIEDCSDGRDNDQDGLVDCEDADCSETCSETSCVDGIDNDLNGYTDCEDEACWGLGSCPSSLSLQVEAATGQAIEQGWGGHWSGTGSGFNEVWTLEELRGRAQIATEMGVHSCSWTAGQVTLRGFGSAYTSSGGVTLSASQVSSTGACRGAIQTSDFAYEDVPFELWPIPWVVGASPWVLYSTLSSSTTVHRDGTWSTFTRARQLNIQPGGWWHKETP